MRSAIAALLLALGATGANAGDAGTLTAAEQALALRHSPLPPPPADETNAVADDPDAARLGRLLFFEPRLSGNGRLSCASCHVARLGLADGRPVSQGLGSGERNVQTLWNVAYSRWLMWDGRADSLWSQSLKPLESPSEMGGNRSAAVGLVARDATLRAAYHAVFGTPPEPLPGPALDRAFANLGKALAAFERTMLSRNAAFDVFAQGLRDGDAAKQAALSPAAQRGLRLFVGRGNCAICHAGPLFSDGEFHDIGVAPADPGRFSGLAALRSDEFSALGAFSDAPDGPRARRTRFVAVRPEMRGQLKTPSLRNVALTAPYMHRGQLATLDDVLEHYSTLADRRDLPQERERILVPLHLTAAEKADLVAFLESLTDDRLAADFAGP